MHSNRQLPPHIAAREVGAVIDLEKIKYCYKQISDSVDTVVVEGVGGWKVPLGDNQYLPDLVSALELSVIMVVGLKLGCINHALLTFGGHKKRWFEVKMLGSKRSRAAILHNRFHSRIPEYQY